MNNDVVAWSRFLGLLRKSFRVMFMVGLVFFSLEACRGPGEVIIPDPLTPAAVTVESRIAASSDDAEESAQGAVNRTSTKLALALPSAKQTVGLRFANLALPQGATISKAYLQFKTAEVSAKATSLTIRGQASDNAPTFSASAASGNVSARARTAAAVTWSPVAWGLIGEAGLKQQTPALTSVIQEIVNRPGWAGGNALAFIITGAGDRVAWSYDGDSMGAPLLHVEYLPVSITLSPSSATLKTGQSLSFSATVSGTSNTRVTWSASSGTVTGTGNTVTYTAPATAGGYTLTATSVADSSKKATATISVTSATAVAVTLNPTSASLLGGATTNFTATVSGTSNTAVTWTASGGTVTGTGNTISYKAPTTAGSYTLTATSVADTTKKAVAPITVTSSSTSVTFAAAGDFGGNDSRAGTVMNDLKTRSAKAFLLLGDMSYDEIVPEKAWCDWVHGYLGANYPMELVAGNHEEDSRVDGHIRNFTACMPDRLNSALGPGGYGVNYAFDLGPVTVVATSPNLTIDNVQYNYGSGSSERQWLVTTVRAAKSEGDWVVAGMHKNCVTIGNKSCEIGQALAQLLIDEHVDLVLQGHDHDYQRSHSLAKVKANAVPSGAIADSGSDNLYTRGAGTVFVITGTVGRSLTTCSHTDAEYGYFATHHCAEESNIKGYLLLNASSTQLEARFIATVGSYSDTFTIR